MAKRITGKEMKCLQALCTGNMEAVKKLIDQIPILRKDLGDERLMIEAASSGSIETLKLLQQQYGEEGAKHLPRGIVMAASNGHIDMVKFLLENGADVNSSDGSPLHFAAYNDKRDMVLFLLENGADIHSGHEAALTHCAGNGNLGMVKLLVKHGADVMYNSQQAYKEARHNRKTAVANYLRKKAEEYIELTSSE